MSEALDPFSLMPNISRVHLFTYVISKLENRADSKAVAAWVVIGVGAVTASVGFIASVYKFLISGVILQFAKMHPNVTSVLSISMLISIAILCIYLYKSNYTNRKLIKLDSGADFRILQSVFFCYIKSKQEQDFCYRYWVKPRKGKCRKFDLNYTWSSHPDTVKVILRNPKFSYEIKSTRLPGVNKLVIDLGEDLDVGHREIIEVVLRTNTDGYNNAFPHFAKSIASPKYPRFNTYIGVVTDDIHELAALYRERSFIALSDIPIVRTAVSLKKGTHIWTIPTTPGWRNCLTWVYKG